MKNEKIYDVLIVGAGPSGSNTAISFKNLDPNLNIGIIDKAIFPRDKSCGDAIGPGVINALKRFNNEHILDDEPQVISTSLFGPDDIGIQNYIPKVKNKDDSVVYVIPRYDKSLLTCASLTFASSASFFEDIPIVLSSISSRHCK